MTQDADTSTSTTGRAVKCSLSNDDEAGVASSRETPSLPPKEAEESTKSSSTGTGTGVVVVSSSSSINNIIENNNKLTGSTGIPLSKSQIKKRTRWQKAQDVKQRRKEQSRQVKRLRAIKDGRDLDAERQQQILNQQDGSGWIRREEKWKQIMANARIDSSFRVCFDCAFEDQMTSKETNSLSLQLRYTYSKNRRSSMPVYIDVCGLKVGCKTREHLENVEGFPERRIGRAFRCHEEMLENIIMYGLRFDCLGDDDNNNIRITDQPSAIVNSNLNPILLPPDHKFVYLTGDSPNTLNTLDDNTTYIIGGIVDRNRLKFAAMERAASIHAKCPSLNIQTARLPLEEHIDFKGSTRILTCNHVFEILQRYRENGYQDWKGAMMAVLPCRKDVEERNDDQDGNVNIGK